MSKMDGLRAMREARYEAAAKASQSAMNPVRRATPAPVAPPSAPVVESETSGERLCGHRAIGGRTCTREHGHAAKSHRYA